MSRLFVKPVKDVQVRDPDHGFAYVPEQGANVPQNNYWLRRLAEGSIRLAEGSVVEAKAPKTRSTTVARKEDK